VVAEFFQRESDALARACHAMARAFARGGSLIPFGVATAATDAAHAAVEFMHPVIVGKRALPAIAPSNDPSGASTLSRLAGPDDIALAISHGAGDPETGRFVSAARARGLLTIEMTAEGDSTEPLFANAEGPAAEYRFAVPARDPAVVQEVHETAYHVLWELVHVFFEQQGLLDESEACITCGDVAVAARVAEVRGATAVIEKNGAREEIAIDLVENVRVGDRLLCHAGVALERVDGDSDPAAFLYPFQGAGPRSDLDAVLADVRSSTLEKAGEVTALRRAIHTEAISGCAEELRRRLEGGGRLIACGNGGSATDAQDMVADALDRGWPALALNNDAATVTAVANDVGSDQIFARQLIALGRPKDVCVAVSTSGGSVNVLAAVEEAKRRGMTTAALAGYDGGQLAELDTLDHLFVVPSDHIPRIQEAQATIYHLLLEAIGDRSPAGDPSPGGVSE
jgi:D-sedoheptulose 7-phosphate isomerase